MSGHTNNFPFRRHALVLALALATGSAPAATLNVSGACKLVNAINNANSDTDTDGNSGCGAGSGDDTLELEANAAYTLTAVNNDTNGANGLPSITSTITINGNGATINRSSEANTPSFRLLNIAENGNLTLNRLKLTGGNVDQSGGGIYNQGKLSLTDSTVSGNSAGFGGGISNYGGNLAVTSSIVSGNDGYWGGGGLSNTFIILNGTFLPGTLTVTNSIISDNNCPGDSMGCGIFNHSDVFTLTNSTVSGNSANIGGGLFVGGNATIMNSTISGNSATWGGGIYSGYFTRTITLTNSTISDNSASQEGGGIDTRWFAYLTLTNCTLSGNNASTGGAIYNDSYNNYGNPLVLITHSTFSNNGGLSTIGTHYPSNTRLTNSIIANSTSADCDALSMPTLNGTNLSEDGSCGTPLIGDPKLRTLLDNGGLTLTHALKGDSPAIAAADSTLCLTTDQRNVKRPTLCDLGAFERKTKIPQSVAPLVQFFDAQVNNGGILGTPGGAIAKYIALRNQLLTAGDYRNRHLKTDACAQLTRTLGYIDPDNTPEASDYVTGSGGGLLIDKINALRGKWSCS